MDNIYNNTQGEKPTEVTETNSETNSESYAERMKRIRLNQKSIDKAGNAQMRKSEYHGHGFDKLTEVNQDNMVKDEYQEKAIDMILRNRFCSVIGCAGTGKTQVTTRAIKELMKEDKFKTPVLYGNENNIRSMLPFVMVTFTNKAVSVLKQRFESLSLEDNCLTIHSLLQYRPFKVPTKFDKYGTIEKVSKQYLPTIGNYIHKIGEVGGTEEVEVINSKLPFKAIFIDEAGNISDELWHNLLSAIEDDCKIIMLGDLAQLPPITGYSPLPFNLSINPSVELINIYRNADGNDIPLVAADIREGRIPDWGKYKDVRFLDIEKTLKQYSDNIKSPTEFEVAQTAIAIIKSAHEQDVYEPINDCIAVATRKCRDYINEAVKHFANPIKYNGNSQIINPQIIIRPLKATYSVGTKVIVDNEDSNNMKLETTNGDNIPKGTLGFIKSIMPNIEYDWDEQEYRQELAQHNITQTAIDEDDTDGEFVNDISMDFNNEKEELEEKLHDAEADNDISEVERIKTQLHHIDELIETDNRVLSHVITVEFETGDIAIIKTASQLRCIRLGYAMTVHKTQGSQYRRTFYIIGGYYGMKGIQNNEACYTAVTRSIDRTYILSTKYDFMATIAKRSLYGKNGYEKSMKLLQKNFNENKTVKVFVPMNSFENKIETNMPIELYNKVSYEVPQHAVKMEDVTKHHPLDLDKIDIQF